MSRRRRAESLALGLVLMSGLGVLGCESPMNVFAPASEMAARTANLTWLMVALAVLVFVIVAVIIVAAALRHRARDPVAVDLSRPGHRFLVVGGIVFPVVVLTTLFIIGMVTMGFAPGRSRAPAQVISVTGHQWWWEVTYDDSALQHRFTTANEIHVPVGEPVRLVLTSGDVIHSFWVPELQGKLDLIPGDTNVLDLTAARAGMYRGQCAEFCGQQHAHMALTVVAEPRADYEQWVASQRAPAREPDDSLARLGQQLFVAGPCALCHTVRGTPALGGVGPDLTHMGSRLTIAAGTLPNTLGNLEGWIANAQSIKPGASMPSMTMYGGRELRALATYVSSLR